EWLGAKPGGHALTTSARAVDAVSATSSAARPARRAIVATLSCGVGRIRIERALPADTARGYRDAAAPAGTTLRISFRVFLCFELFRAVIGLVSLGAVLLFALGTTWGAIVAASLFAYVAAAIFVNRAELTLAGGALRSRLGPIPIFPSKTLDAAKV